MLRISTYDGSIDETIGNAMSGYTVTFVRDGEQEGDLPDFRLERITWDLDGRLVYEVTEVDEDGNVIDEDDVAEFGVDECVLVVY